MHRVDTRLEGPLLLEPEVHSDERGFFLETARRSTLESMGVDVEWVQENHSRSRRATIRGMHFQIGAGQAKLVRCSRGAIVDVVVDIRPGSPTFGEWEAHRLDDERHLQLLVPIGFAHGFCVVSEFADVLYKCSTYHDPAIERGFAYDDPDLAIDWPAAEPIVSERDRTAPRLAEVAAELPFEYAA